MSPSARACPKGSRSAKQGVEPNSRAQYTACASLIASKEECTREKRKEYSPQSAYPIRTVHRKFSGDRAAHSTQGWARCVGLYGEVYGAEQEGTCKCRAEERICAVSRHIFTTCRSQSIRTVAGTEGERRKMFIARNIGTD